MRNPEVTREVILKQAGVLFNTKGYKATSISDITSATGLTKGAIYRHFDSKEDLEKEALTHLSQKMFEHMRVLIREQNNAPAKLRAICRYFEEYVGKPLIRGGCPLMNVAIEADDAHPALRRRAVSILNVLRESMIHILDTGIKKKQLKSGIDKEYYAVIFIAALEGGIMMSKLRGDKHDIRITIKHLENLIAEIEV